MYFEVTETLTHVHAAQITEYFKEEDLGIQMIVSIGDTQGHNRFIRYVLSDRDADYWDPGNWDITDQFHGRHADISGDPPDPGSQSMQPASVCFGAGYGRILWGSDTMHDWISEMLAPMTSSGQAKFSHIYGLKWCSWDVNPYSLTVQLSTIKDQLPEQAGNSNSPAAAILYGGGPDVTESFNRVLYTPSVSSVVDTWAMVASSDGGETAVVYGDYIYWNRRFGTTPFNKVLRPQILRRRPVLVAPGGINLAKANCDYVDEDIFGRTVSADVDALSEDSMNPGVYLDGSLSLPRVPCIPAAVFKVVMSRMATAPSSREASAGQFLISKSGGNTLSWITGGGADTSFVRRWRAWVLDGTYDQASAVNPNKTTSLALSAFDSVNTTNAALKYSCGDRWCPLPAIALRLIPGAGGPAPFAFPLDLIGSDSGTPSDDNYFYMAVAEALDGQGSLPYPLAPITGSSNPATPTPNEVLRVTGLNLSTSQHWQLRVVGMQAIGNWDSFSSRETTPGSGSSERYWPLFHLYSDSGGVVRAIQFMADCQNHKFRVRIRLGGSFTDYTFSTSRHDWIPDAQLMVVIAFDGTSIAPKLIVGASLGGDQTRTTTISNPFGGASPTFSELRFSATELEAVADEVVEFRWFGGDYDDDVSSAPTESSVAEALEDLSFLDE